MARNLSATQRAELELLDCLKDARQLLGDMRSMIYGRPVHVYPLNGTTHVLHGDGCWCDPRVERQRDAADVVIHNRVQ